MKNYFSIYSLTLLVLSCQQDLGKLKPFFSLPNNLKEVSGVVYLPETDLLWTLEDSGNDNKIYSLNSDGAIVNEITIANTANVDWEDIAKDKQGNLYIGDFGNNHNDRKNLCIYKINKKMLNAKEATPDYKVTFYYPEQKDFPPKKKELFYDVEGFFELNNYFYLFTKDRSKDFKGMTSLYKIPNKAGHHKAELLGSIKLGKNYDDAAITSATISPDNSKVILLSHSKIWIFKDFKSDNFLSGDLKMGDLKHYSQKESIAFKDANTIFIADEKVKKTGGNVYKLNLDKIKLETKP
ncbi:hypothetical protein [Flavobacterium sp. PL002]|uniref:hypothetical protein n=1 Tax=Flavobacterium sp. PL002 TaxID=1897058 RepID=UPI0017878623|nr:hypothetical protein [Flavobacterium sp. PL002]MBE0390508.1 hypothetical protein [Flavobacterium sp. PL002]